MRNAGIGHFFQRINNCVSVYGTQVLENVRRFSGKTLVRDGVRYEEYPAIIEDVDRIYAEENRNDVRVVRKLLRIEERFLPVCPESMRFLIDGNEYEQEVPAEKKRGWWSITVVDTRYLSVERSAYGR